MWGPCFEWSKLWNEPHLKPHGKILAVHIFLFCFDGGCMGLPRSINYHIQAPIYILYATILMRKNGIWWPPTLYIASRLESIDIYWLNWYLLYIYVILGCEEVLTSFYQSNLTAPNRFEDGYLLVQSYSSKTCWHSSSNLEGHQVKLLKLSLNFGEDL